MAARWKRFEVITIRDSVVIFAARWKRFEVITTRESVVLIALLTAIIPNFEECFLCWNSHFALGDYFVKLILLDKCKGLPVVDLLVFEGLGVLFNLGWYETCSLRYLFEHFVNLRSQFRRSNLCHFLWSCKGFRFIFIFLR